MSSREECWNKYAAHLKTWYVNTYSGHLGGVRAINDGRLIRKIALIRQDSLSYRDLKDGGVSEFGAKTIILYISNTKDSYMGRCITDTGGFDPEVECMGDSDCPPGYRCRGRGKDSLCVEEAEPPKVESPLIGLPDIGLPDVKVETGIGETMGGLKRSLQMTGVVVMVFVLAIFYLIFVKGKGAEGATIGKVG